MLKGHEAVEFDIRQPRLRWPVDSEIYELSGNRIGQLKRRGKYILMPIADSHLIWHLGMSGSLRICQQDGPRKKHDHIEIFLDSGKSLVYHDPRRFGALLLTHDDPYQHKVIVSLGVEPLSHDFDDDYVFRVSRHKSTPIKSLIMDSHQLVGVGNIYACESLYAAGINPTRAAGSLSRKRLQRLVIEIRKVLNAAITQGGSTLRDFIQADGQPGYFAQSLNVYGNQGNCPGCDKAVKRIQQNQRSTFYCTNCQT